MNLHDWIDKQISEGKARTRHEAIEGLRAKTGDLVSISLLSQIDRGMKLKTVDRAKAIEKATDGEILVGDLT